MIRSLLVGVMLGALAVPASAQAIPAGPTVTGLEIVSATSAGGSPYLASAQVNCPSGKKVFGGGARINGGLGQVHVDDAYPYTNASGFEALAVEDQDGFGGDWSITAYAVCANPLPYQQVVWAESVVDSNNKNVSANCPASTYAVGGGAELNYATGQVVLGELRTFSTGVSATGREDGDGFGANWMIRVYAICAVQPGGYEVLSGVSDADSTSPKYVNQGCTGSRRLLSLGWSTYGPAGGQVMVDFAVPYSASAAIMGREDQDGVAADWALHARAVCASGLS